MVGYEGDLAVPLAAGAEPPSLHPLAVALSGLLGRPGGTASSAGGGLVMRGTSRSPSLRGQSPLRFTPWRSPCRACSAVPEGRPPVLGGVGYEGDLAVPLAAGAEPPSLHPLAVALSGLLGRPGGTASSAGGASVVERRFLRFTPWRSPCRACSAVLEGRPPVLGGRRRLRGGSFAPSSWRSPCRACSAVPEGRPPVLGGRRWSRGGSFAPSSWRWSCWACSAVPEGRPPVLGGRRWWGGGSFAPSSWR